MITPKTIAAAVRGRLSAARARRAASAASVPGITGGPLHTARTVALWLSSGVILSANGAAFTESYRGLYEWAARHGLHGIWSAAFPLQVDSFIAVGELMLFVAMVDGWRARHRIEAWGASGLGLAISVAGNVGHVGAATLQDHGTAAIPPCAAFGGLWLGVRIVKRVLEMRPAPAAEAEERRRHGPTCQCTPCRQAYDPDVPAPHEIPADAEHAARIALRATAAAGNPLSQNQLQEKFGITRTAAQRIRRELEAPKTEKAVA